MLGDQLYRRGIVSSVLKCVEMDRVKEIMAEVHEGMCSCHIVGCSLAVKVLKAGFYWPTLKNDCIDHVKKCSKCQIYADLQRATPEQLTTMTSPWPFAMWGRIFWVLFQLQRHK